MGLRGLRKQATVRDATNGFLAKWRLRDKCGNSILMTTQIWEVLLIGWGKFSNTAYWLWWRIFMACYWMSFYSYQINAEIKTVKKELKRTRTVLQLDELKCRRRVLRRYSCNTYCNVVLFSCYVLINSVFLLRQELNCCLAQALQAVFPLIGTLIIIASDKQTKAELTSAYGSAFRS